MYGVPQKKFSLFWEHVTFHNLCLLQGIYVNRVTFETNAIRMTSSVQAQDARLVAEFKHSYAYLD